MTTAMMMERSTMGMGMPGMAPPMPMPSTGMPGMNMYMLPHCTFKVEKCQGGMKIHCNCDDAVACSMVQNMCTMLQGGMCCLTCMMNGMQVCCCNMAMAMCKCDMTKSGVCVTCTSGDSK